MASSAHINRNPNVATTYAFFCYRKKWDQYRAGNSGQDPLQVKLFACFSRIRTVEDVLRHGLSSEIQQLNPLAPPPLLGTVQQILPIKNNSSIISQFHEPYIFMAFHTVFDIVLNIGNTGCYEFELRVGINEFLPILCFVSLRCSHSL
jgi:hypothetical protein